MVHRAVIAIRAEQHVGGPAKADHLRHRQRIPAAFQDAVAVGPVALRTALPQLRREFGQQRLVSPTPSSRRLAASRASQWSKTLLGEAAKILRASVGPARKKAGIAKPQGLPSVAIALDEDQACGRRVIILRQVELRRGVVQSAMRPSTSSERMRWSGMSRRPCRRAAMRAADQPLRIAFTAADGSGG